MEKALKRSVKRNMHFYEMEKRKFWCRKISGSMGISLGWYFLGTTHPNLLSPQSLSGHSLKKLMQMGSFLNAFLSFNSLWPDSWWDYFCRCLACAYKCGKENGALITRVSTLKLTRLQRRELTMLCMKCCGLLDLGGTIPFTTEIWIHICSCHNFFSLSSVQIFFITSLLLIMCALKWYVKCLYRHLLLEDISKHARITKKWHLPNCNMFNSKAPWGTDSKFVVWLANTLSYDITKPYLQYVKC